MQGALGCMMLPISAFAYLLACSRPNLRHVSATAQKPQTARCLVVLLIPMSMSVCSSAHSFTPGARPQ
eukprot:1161815-Pelagomonas_calceolata.AAC.16